MRGEGHSLHRLNGLRIGAFSIELLCLEPMRMSGWRRFSLGLIDASGAPSAQPIIEGIFSGGGKGVRPWIEVYGYFPVLSFSRGDPVDFQQLGMVLTLFRHFHDLLTPGSHIMLWYEGVSGRETEFYLRKGIPPVLTPFGLLLFEAGFLSVRDFYFPEGGIEGGRKLWAERPLNPTAERTLAEKIGCEIKSYLSQPARADLLDIERRAREAAVRVLRDMKVPGRG